MSNKEKDRRMNEELVSEKVLRSVVGGSISKSDVKKFIVDNKKTIVIVAGILGTTLLSVIGIGGKKIHQKIKENYDNNSLINAKVIDSVNFDEAPEKANQLKSQVQQRALMRAKRVVSSDEATVTSTIPATAAKKPVVSQLDTAIAPRPTFEPLTGIMVRTSQSQSQSQVQPISPVTTPQTAAITLPVGKGKQMEKPAPLMSPQQRATLFEDLTTPSDERANSLFEDD